MIDKSQKSHGKTTSTKEQRKKRIEKEVEVEEESN